MAAALNRQWPGATSSILGRHNRRASPSCFQDDLLASVRETARIRIDKNLPLGAKIAIESYSPFVNPAQFSVQGFGRMIEHEPEWYLEQDFDYLVFGQAMYGRFYQDPERYRNETLQYDELFGQFNLTIIFTDGNYEVRVYRVK